jgi:hypothetical protein
VIDHLEPVHASSSLEFKDIVMYIFLSYHSCMRSVSAAYRLAQKRAKIHYFPLLSDCKDDTMVYYMQPFRKNRKIILNLLKICRIIEYYSVKLWSCRFIESIFDLARNRRSR